MLNCCNRKGYWNSQGGDSTEGREDGERNNAYS